MPRTRKSQIFGQKSKEGEGLYAGLYVALLACPLLFRTLTLRGSCSGIRGPWQLPSAREMSLYYQGLPLPAYLFNHLHSVDAESLATVHTLRDYIKELADVLKGHVHHLQGFLHFLSCTRPCRHISRDLAPGHATVLRLGNLRGSSFTLSRYNLMDLNVAC